SRLGVTEGREENALITTMILIRQIEEVVAAADGLVGRFDADTALIQLAGFGSLAVDIPVKHLIFRALHHGTERKTLIGQVAANHVHRLGVRHDQYHGAPGGELRLYVFPAPYLDAAFEMRGAAQ